MAWLSGFACLFLVLLTVEGCAGSSRDRSNAVPELQRLKVVGDKARNGIFDASLEYHSDGTGWMAYSSIEIPEYVETHVAKSEDNGKTWTFIGKPNSSVDFQRAAKSGKVTEGVWRHETPSLLFDPLDVPERRWKLFTNRYPVLKPFGPTDRRMSEGSIEVQYASSPDGVWSKPICVIGSSIGCRADISKMDASLADVKSMTEPGTIIHNATIYMSMDVSTKENGLGDWERYRVILLASKDRGVNWHYVGTLLNHNEAMRFKYRVFTGTSLVRERGEIYLMATPSGATRKAQQDHDGTMVMEVADISQAKLTRDGIGAPVVVKRITVEKQSGGLADYDEQNTAGGIVFSQISLFGMPEVFQLWSTGETRVGAP